MAIVTSWLEEEEIEPVFHSSKVGLGKSLMDAVFVQVHRNVLNDAATPDYIIF